MMQCSEKAFAMCPTRHLCGSRDDATFTDDSECAEFNRHVEDLPMIMETTKAERLIDVNALISDLRSFKGLGAIVGETLVRFVEKQPTVDAVEVVRCGNCARALDLGHSDYVLCRGRVVFRDGYCADGVRL